MNLKKMETCCVSGHRPSRLKWRNDEDDAECVALKEELENVLAKAIEAGYKYFLVGGALGVDMYCAEIILKLKKKYPQIELEFDLPFIGYEKLWNQKDKTRLHKLIKQANTVYYVSENADNGNEVYHVRNHYMVDNSSLLVAVWNGSPSGTSSTIRYAKKVGCLVNILMLDNND